MFLIVGVPPARFDASKAAPEIVLLSPSNVPLFMLKVRVAPIIRASASFTVPPMPLAAKGSSMVMAFDVKICVPDVAPKVRVPEDAAKVIPVESVKFP